MANNESKITVTQRHNIKVDELKKKIDLRKEDFIIKNHNKLSDFSFQWTQDVASFNISVSYDLLELGIDSGLIASGYVIAAVTEITVHIESNIPQDTFHTHRSKIENKVIEELNSIINLQLP